MVYLLTVYIFYSKTQFPPFILTSMERGGIKHTGSLFFVFFFFSYIPTLCYVPSNESRFVFKQLLRISNVLPPSSSSFSSYLHFLSFFLSHFFLLILPVVSEWLAVLRGIYVYECISRYHIRTLSFFFPPKWYAPNKVKKSKGMVTEFEFTSVMLAKSVKTWVLGPFG